MIIQQNIGRLEPLHADLLYAVGLAHLLDSNNGLVDTLQQAGYTVELVQFAS